MSSKNNDKVMNINNILVPSLELCVHLYDDESFVDTSKLISLCRDVCSHCNTYTSYDNEKLVNHERGRAKSVAYRGIYDRIQLNDMGEHMNKMDDQLNHTQTESNTRTFLFALPIPSQLLIKYSLEYYHTNDNIYEGLESLLSTIHPSLVSLTPCGFLTSKYYENYSLRTDECSSQSQQRSMNSFDILLLYGTIDQRNRYLDFVIDIMNQVNGQSMIGAPDAVIDLIPISSIKFESEHRQVEEIKIPPVRCTEIIPQSTTSTIISHESNTPVTKSSDTSLLTLNISTSPVLPICPVCRYRIEPNRLGSLQEPKHRCSQKCIHHDNYHRSKFCINTHFLLPWATRPTYCEACHVIQNKLLLTGAKLPYSNLSSLTSSLKRDEIIPKCYECNMKETLWICLTCGVVGCGRYSHGHAQKHYQTQKHPFSLELATQRIWDYETSTFIQRDDLICCPCMQECLGEVNRAVYRSGALILNPTTNYINANESNDIDDVGMNDTCSRIGPFYRRYDQDVIPTKKAMTLGEEYEALLQSALEDQAQHYEGEICHLQAKLASQDVDQTHLSPDEIKEVNDLEEEIKSLRREVEAWNKKVIDVQGEEAGHRAKSTRLLREQSIAKAVLDKIRAESVREQESGKKQMEELEQQISDLATNLQMRQQFAQNEELCNAQIYGTSSQEKKTKGKRSRRASRK